MQKVDKKVAAALAAVQLYMQQEEEAAAAVCLEQAQPPVRNLTSEPGQWAQSGRVEMMAGRRLIQLRAFSNAR